MFTLAKKKKIKNKGGRKMNLLSGNKWCSAAGRLDCLVKDKHIIFPSQAQAIKYRLLSIRDPE